MAGKATVVIEKDEHGFYTWCPELKGCQTQGVTLEEAMANIKEAIDLYLETLPADERDHRRVAELVFEVVQEADGGYCAECLTENIFTEGNTWQQLREKVLEATTAFFFDRPRPERLRLHLVRDEILSVA